MGIEEIIDALERAPRKGADADESESSRYVVISEATLNTIVRELRKWLGERPEAEYFSAE